MFSFVGDTVLDPFTGTASTQVAAAAFGRNSVGVEVDPVYFEMATERLRNATGGLLKTVEVHTGTVGPEADADESSANHVIGNGHG